MTLAGFLAVLVRHDPARDHEPPPAQLVDKPRRPAEHAPVSDEHSALAGAGALAGLDDEEGEPARPEQRVWSVSEVNGSVRSLLEDFLPPLWVSGEVANWKRHHSGHRFFTLKDENAQLRCVMWRGDASRRPVDPEDGMNVRAFGGLTLYEQRGDYQLVVRRLEAEDAEGLWRLAFEKLRRKLDGEGLLAPARKRPIPRFPSCVGVVTSPTGAALRDILSVIRRRAPWTRVLVRGARVQGEGAAAEVAGAIEALVHSGRCQVIIVGRGGGSIEDLWAFNEEVLARAICACPVPVISAVGHEVDVTIADLVADLRAPTPSAGAEAAVQDGAALVTALRRLPERLTRALRACAERRRNEVDTGMERLERALRRRLDPLEGRARRSMDGLERGMGRQMDRRRQALAAAAGKLEALSPLSTLQRGYAVAQDDDGRLLRRVGDFAPGRGFDLRLWDGRVRCEVDETTEEEPFGG
ncbi:MAG: exodeoxyribonuclease VII large subunit [Gemmatimonadetes bacterium]|nr:exodeoxyribonuclease VII large subunit [Gemmatimonadota bacterium]